MANGCVTSVDNSDLDAVFSDTTTEIDELKERLKGDIIRGIQNYPYDIDSTTFNVNATTNQNTRTLWEEFLDNVMSNRHAIAHGAISGNPNSIEEIKTNLVKIEILQLAILMLVCEKAVQEKVALPTPQ